MLMTLIIIIVLMFFVTGLISNIMYMYDFFKRLDEKDEKEEKKKLQE